MLSKYKYIFLIFLVSIVLFWQFFLKGLIPLPADTIVGMYHPWRDLYSKDYPNGIPYSNPLITDPVRQQFVWKKLVIDSYKNGKLPMENPYSFSGYPLLANFQSGAFYPLNILFFIFSFNFAWGLYIFLQFLLGGFFMFLFLRNLFSHSEHSEESSFNPIAFLGSIVWILSGFWIAWAEWGNILHTALWLPLILLATDKIMFSTFEVARQRPRLLRGGLIWFFVYLFSLLSSFFAGHLQTFFYIYVFSFFYFLFLLLTTNYKLRICLLFLILNSIFLILSAIQWYPTLQFILVSGRNVDVQNILTRDDWFIPLKHFAQLFIPDYFGNPAKGNYFGVWNYGEFLSYIGIIPIFLAIYGIIKSIMSKKNIFWLIKLLIVTIFITKNPISEIPYRLAIPFFSTAQPSRLIFLLDFLLVIFFVKTMMNHFDNSNYRSGRFFSCDLPFLRMQGSNIIFLIFLILIVSTSFFQLDYQSIILRNSIQPVIIFTIFTLLTLISRIIHNPKLVFPLLLLFIFFDQSRVFWRFNTFTEEKYIFPETKITRFLQNDLKNGFFRISSLDARIIPPNFSSFYGLSSIDGYDPLYYKSYSDLLGGKDAKFNRIIQLSSVNSDVYNKLRVKYVLSFNDLPKDDFRLVLTEGQTKVFKYKGFK